MVYRIDTFYSGHRETIKTHPIHPHDMAEKQPTSYIYEPGKFVGTCRKIGTNSVCVTVPKKMVQAMALRPGVTVMVYMERAKAAPVPKEEEEE